MMNPKILSCLNQASSWFYNNLVIKRLLSRLEANEVGRGLFRLLLFIKVGISLLSMMCPPSSPSAEIIVIERPAGDFSLPFEALDLKVLVIKYRDPQHFTLVHAFSIISLLLEPYTSPTNFYKELPNSDFPSLHDYDCSNSRLFDACQLAVYDVTEAKYKCDLDDRCKAFVTTARTLWTGEWRQSMMN